MSLAQQLKHQAADDWFDRLGNMQFIDDQKGVGELDHNFCNAMLNDETCRHGMSVLTLML